MSTTPQAGTNTLRWILLTIAFVLGVIQIKSCRAENEKKAALDASVTTHRTNTFTPAPATAPTVEALVPEHECLTPCSTFVGWSYKIRTDGDPFRVKYHGCDWVDRPGKGDFNAPKCFEPGEAQFVSSDEKNLHIRVQVYKKIIVPQGR